MNAGLRVRRLGRLDYRTSLLAMQQQVAARDPASPDELWLVEHPPVYTLGLRGVRRHVHGVPEALLVQSDRGGEVTWHGPGQVLVYVLLDLQRRGLGVRELVFCLEAAVIEVLRAEGVPAEREAGAPGVYVAGAKIAALGLRVRRGCSYHGLALNVDCALGAFSLIDPCGVPGRRVTRTRDLGLDGDVALWGERLVGALTRQLDADQAAALPISRVA